METRDINLPLRQGNQVKFSQWQTNFIRSVLAATINFAAARDVYNSPRLIVPKVLRISAFRAPLLCSSRLPCIVRRVSPLFFAACVSAERKNIPIPSYLYYVSSSFLTFFFLQLYFSLMMRFRNSTIQI